VSAEALELYLRERAHLGDPLPGSALGRAGGAACGDLLSISLRLEGGSVADVRRAGSGCAAARAASAAVAELVDGARLADAALLGPGDVSAELGGLSAVGKHAAELAAEALHRALGAAVLSTDDPLLPSPPSGAERVLVALSGGVDSAVVALRERERGAEVVAITLELWSDPANDGERSCCSADAVRGARSLAHSLGIPHLTVDLRRRFRAGVVEPFLAGHAAGATPNPCVRCNGRVRIEPMIEIAQRLGAGALATGHYARIADDGSGEPLLAAAADPAKDQSYMLAGLAPSALRRLRFPLGELTKQEVRVLAREAGLAVAEKAESQDLCFLAGEGKAGFLARHGGLADREGELTDREGNVLGTHAGHHLFTVGQRRGIGLAASEPLYVLATDAESNRVTVGSATELEVGRVAIRDAVLHRPAERVGSVRLRYRSRPLRCRLGVGVGTGTGKRLGPGVHERLEVVLEEPARAAAPGQTAVLCDGDLVIGHGTIA